MSRANTRLEIISFLCSNGKPVIPLSKHFAAQNMDNMFSQRHALNTTIFSKFEYIKWRKGQERNLHVYLSS